MKTLEETKKEKQYWEEHTKQKQVEYNIAKSALKTIEANLKATKKHKNKTERELKFSKKMVERLDKKIRGTPSRVRKWGKEHPGELINTLGGKYN